MTEPLEHMRLSDIPMRNRDGTIAQGEEHLVAFAHPETGEILETRDQFQDALTEIELRMSPMWIVRRQIREAYAERFDPTLPSPVYRTVTQEKVARCPRCGSRLQA